MNHSDSDDDEEMKKEYKYARITFDLQDQNIFFKQ